MSIYFVQGNTGGLIKIDYATDAASRFSALQVGSPVLLRTLGVIEGAPRRVERWLHDHFDEEREHGEWFAPSSRLLTFIVEASRPQRHVHRIGTRHCRVCWSLVAGEMAPCSKCGDVVPEHLLYVATGRPA